MNLNEIKNNPVDSDSNNSSNFNITPQVMDSGISIVEVKDQTEVEFIDRNIKDGAKMYSNYKKWVIHFLMEYYRRLNTYFCKS